MGYHHFRLVWLQYKIYIRQQRDNNILFVVLYKYQYLFVKVVVVHNLLEIENLVVHYHKIGYHQHKSGLPMNKLKLVGHHISHKDLNLEVHNHNRIYKILDIGLGLGILDLLVNYHW